MHHRAVAVEIQRTKQARVAAATVVFVILRNCLVCLHVLLLPNLFLNKMISVCVYSAAAMFGPYGAFMPENLAAFAAGLNPASVLNAAFGGSGTGSIPTNPISANNFASRSLHPSTGLNDLYSAMRLPQQPPNPLLTITSATAATSGNIIERNGTKQHYSFHCDSFNPSPSPSSLQPYTFPADTFDSVGCPRRTKILSSLIHGDVVCAVTISDQNKHVYTGGKGCVKIWDLKESISNNENSNGRTSPLTISKPIAQFECLVKQNFEI